MTNADPASDPTEQIGEEPIVLTIWQRVGLCASGLGLVGAGGWSQIASGKDGAGTVAFVAAGTLAGALGIIGRMPNRLSGSNFSAEWHRAVDKKAQQQVNERVVDLVEVLPSEAKRELVESDDSEAFDAFASATATGKATALESFLAQRISDLSLAKSTAERSLAFESVVRSNLFRALDMNDIADKPMTSGIPSHLDALLTLGSRRIGFDIKVRTQQWWEMSTLNQTTLGALALSKWNLDAWIAITEHGTVVFDRNADTWRYPGFPSLKLLSKVVAEHVVERSAPPR